MSDPTRTLLARQLGIPWSFAESFILGRIHRDVALWEPGTNVVTVRQSAAGWVADWRDEENRPLPTATVAWLLWHIEWWWTNAAKAVEGQPLIPPGQAGWSGGTEGIVEAKRHWDELLATQDLSSEVHGLMPRTESFAFVAAWVTFELTKNLAEIHQLICLHANRTSQG